MTMGFDTLKTIVDHLKTGTIPEDKNIQHVCTMASVYYVAFVMYSSDIGRSISFHLMDVENKYGMALIHVHTTWTSLVMAKVLKVKDILVGEFNGVSVEKLSDSIEIYAAYTDILEHTCSWCKQKFTSDVNRCRCENSHVSRKNLLDRSILPISSLSRYWNTLDESKRKSIVSTSTKYLTGIPSGSNFPAAVCNVIRLAAGRVNLTGNELMVALDVASENTFLYRPARAMKQMAIVHRGDFVAAIADEIIKSLAQHYADEMSLALLSEESEKQKVKKPRVSVKKKKRVRAKKEFPKHIISDIEEEDLVISMSYDDADVALALESQIQKQIELEESYSREAYISRLEKLIFASPAITSVGSWADFEY